MDTLISFTICNHIHFPSSQIFRVSEVQCFRVSFKICLFIHFNRIALSNALDNELVSIY